jgi:phage terminase small subunit
MIDPSSDEWQPPTKLGDHGAWKWRQIVNRIPHLLKPIDVFMLEQVCFTYEMTMRCEALAEKFPEDVDALEAAVDWREQFEKGAAKFYEFEPSQWLKKKGDR